MISRIFNAFRDRRTLIQNTLSTLSLSGLLACSPPQITAQRTAHCINPEFDKKVARTIRQSIPLMDVQELYQNSQNLLIFDARERDEYEVSHIPGAKFLGYQSPDWKALEGVPKDKPIVVYCSIGYRSEKSGELLQSKGFSKVYNLYGSIFEWVNRGYSVVNTRGDTVAQIHTYNKAWSQWVQQTQLLKIW